MISENRIEEECVRFESEGLRLEGILSYPSATEPVTALLLLNPHPHFGGNLKNNVVRHVASRAAADGAAVLRFNYRGVGESQIRLPAGESIFNHWEYMEKVRRYDELIPDCRAALEFLCRSAVNVPVSVVGYSLGAVLAAMISGAPEVQRVAAVSPPVERVPLSIYANCAKRQLFVAGDRDPFASRQGLESACLLLSQIDGIRFVHNADHFYRSRENDLYEILRTFIFA